MEPKVEGCSVKGVEYVPEMLETLENMGLIPCNTLSMPDKATVIAILCSVVRGCMESKVEAPDVGWAKESVC